MIEVRNVFTPAFDDERHVYFRDKVGVGRAIPSVTQILKPVSALSYKGIPESILQRAADLGTAVHACIELSLIDDLDETSIQDEWLPYFSAFMKFMSEVKPKTVATEQLFACDFFAGTVDYICQIDGELWVIDWKTTNKLMPQVAIQTAAYETLARCSGLYTSDLMRRGAVQLKNDGTYVFETYTKLEDYLMFEQLLNIHQWIEQNV